MKRISIILSLALSCTLLSAQVYFYGFSSSPGIVAEFDHNPDSVITIPLYRTPLPAQNEGALSGVFSVSPTRKVRFSKGNLQYGTSTGVWKFAEHQYDTVGGNISSPSVDLFGYGTSGWAGSGAIAYLPTDTSTNASDYQATFAGAQLADLTGYMEHRDWGIHNAIQNGGNSAGLWRLLTFRELEKVSAYRWEPYAEAYVNGVLGIVLLPDNWDDSNNPNEFKIHPYVKYDRNWKELTTLTEAEISAILVKYNNDTIRARSELMIGLDPVYHNGDDNGRPLVETYYDEEHNPYWYPLEDYNVTPEEWLQYEALGCVFLPFVPARNHPDNYRRENNGVILQETLYSIYWTSFSGSVLNLQYRGPQSSYHNPLSRQSNSFYYPYVGGCVRLVQDY